MASRFQYLYYTRFDPLENDLKTRSLTYRQVLILSAIVFVLSFLAAWTFGGAALYPWQLLEQGDNEMAKHILLSIRLPRIACACIVGAALSVAGMLTQGLFRNPLASPSVIGISSGGSLGAIIAFYLGLHHAGLWTLPMFAFVGCVATTIIILALARSANFAAVEDLLLVGFAMNSILSAISTFILSLSLKDFDKGPAMMNWMLGNLAGKTWDHVNIGVVPIVLALFAGLHLSYQLNVLSLGNDVAQTIGIRLKRLRLQSIMVVSVLVATAVSIGGILPFLGLIVPHFSRLMVGSDHKKLFFVSAINGMTLLLLADLAARVMISPAEIQVGVLISLFGSPFFLWMFYKRRRSYAQ
ncbi:MAG: iron ABC transporter permease [Proteobacteria bacterium]|nr:MAG: iron ABC transporter permease [Pseudomonadota bacterium]